MLVFMCLLKSPAWIDAKSQELQICEISPLNDFQMSSQIAWLNRCNVTLVACVWFSQMLVFMCLLKTPAWIDAKSQELQICEISPLNDFQTSSQIAWLNRCKVTLVACHMSNVSFHVSSKIAYLNKCKVTRVAKIFKYVTKTSAC